MSSALSSWPSMTNDWGQGWGGGLPWLPKTQSHGQLPKRVEAGTSLVVQWVRLHAPSAGGPGLIPGRGTRSCIHAAMKILRAATKTWRSQNK